MSISLLFSSIIYQTSMDEINTRFDAFATRLQDSSAEYTAQDVLQFNTFRSSQLSKSQANLLLALFYTNIAILIVAGLGSYFLARKSLKPIEKSHEAQSRFTSDASHELRTPLAVMKSELEVALRSKKLSSDEMRELLVSNLEEVNRLSDLSSMLLQLSRSEISQLDMKKIDIVKIVEKVIKSQKKLSSNRIELEVESKSSFIRGDSASISELFVILIDNALRYSPAKSKIQIQIFSAGGTVTTKVTNAGQGISSEDLPYIFDRFYRGEKSRSSQKETGYGLGLSLAKNIVELHEGSIRIESKPDDFTSVITTFRKISKK
jgi:signal transduction histidine kinase